MFIVFDGGRAFRSGRRYSDHGGCTWLQFVESGLKVPFYSTSHTRFQNNASPMLEILNLHGRKTVRDTELSPPRALSRVLTRVKYIIYCILVLSFGLFVFLFKC